MSTCCFIVVSFQIRGILTQFLRPRIYRSTWAGERRSERDEAFANESHVTWSRGVGECQPRARGLGVGSPTLVSSPWSVWWNGSDWPRTISVVSSSYVQASCDLIPTLIRNAMVLKASSRNGFEQIPFVVTPRSADNSKLVASLAACPKAMTVCPRGMAIVSITLPVAGSHNH